MNGLFSVSERLHSGLILLAELQAAPERLQSLHEIGERMQLSEGYLEEVVALLRKAGFVEGKRGATGGYRLAKAAKNISLLDVVTAIEGEVALVSCQARGVACAVSERCRTKHVWSQVQQKIQDTLKNISLADLSSVSSYEKTHLS